MAATTRQVSLAAAATPVVEFVLGVSATAPGVARAELRRWLDGLGWPADEAEQLVFCVSEAVTNIVEHAYPDVIDDPTRFVHISARHEIVADPGLACRLRWVCIDIHDTGRWRDPDPHRRGLGLHLSRRLLDNLVIITRGSPDYGTTVSLRSHPVDQPDPSGRIPIHRPPPRG